jgi:hypothetical protein
MDEMSEMQIAALKQADSHDGIDPSSIDNFFVTVVFPLIDAGFLESGFPIRITPKGRVVLARREQNGCDQPR